MPNVKLYIDEAALARIADRIEPALSDLRQSLCRMFGVAVQACHIVIIPVRAPAGQTPANVELTILQKPDRSHDAVEAICADLQAMLEGLFDLRAAIRCTLVQPDSYVVRR